MSVENVMEVGTIGNIKPKHELKQVVLALLAHDTKFKLGGLKMAEYICREAIIDDLEKEIEAGNVALDEDVWINKGLRIAIRDIKDSKSADVQPVRRGKWIEVSPKHSKCSCCETTCLIAQYPISANANYCPNCGADMRGEDNAESNR